jgi:hypothetical protein
MEVCYLFIYLFICRWAVTILEHCISMTEWDIKFQQMLKDSYVGKWIVDGQMEGWLDKWIDR